MNNTPTNRYESDTFDLIRELFENDRSVSRQDLENLGCSLEENRQLQLALTPWREKFKILQELGGKQPASWFQEILKSLLEDLFQKTILKASPSSSDKQIDQKLEVLETPMLVHTIQNNPSGSLHNFIEAFFLKYIPEILYSFKTQIDEVGKNLRIQEGKLTEFNNHFENTQQKEKKSAIEQQGDLQLRITSIEHELAQLHADLDKFRRHFTDPQIPLETVFSTVEKLAERFGIPFGIDPVINDLGKAQGSMIISMRQRKNNRHQKAAPNEVNPSPFSPQSKIGALVVAVTLAVGTFIMSNNKEKPRSNDASFPTSSTPQRSAPNSNNLEPEENRSKQAEKMEFSQLQTGLTSLSNDPECVDFLLEFYRQNPGKIEATPYTSEGVKMIHRLPSGNSDTRQLIVNFTIDPEGNASWQNQDVSFKVKEEYIPSLIRAYNQRPRSPFPPQPNFPNPNAPRPNRFGPYQPFP